jgi:hypothetical protein
MEPEMRFTKSGAVAVAFAVLVMAAASALLLAAPGRTISTKFLNDLVIFLDGAHRVVSGQLPNRDFHTPMGALAYLLPAAGLWLSGTMGAALPVAMGLVLLLFAPALAYVLGSRLRPSLALPLAAYLILILAAPLNVGDSPENLSFAMFYNRIGWAGLATLLILYLPVRPGLAASPLWDAISATLLVLVLIYTKMSYGVVGVGFLACLLLDPARRSWAGLGLIGTVVGVIAVEMQWRSSAAYLADLALAGEVSGAFWGGVERLLEAARANLFDYFLYAVVVALALSSSRSARDLVFYGFCAAAGLLLLNQNYQLTGVVVLGAAGVVGAELAVRRGQDGSRFAAARRGAAYLLVVGLLAPTLVERSMAFGTHVALAFRPPAQDLGLPRFGDARLAAIGTPGDLSFSLAYIATLEDGARALSAIEPKPSRVFVLDFVNPFSAGVGLEPPRGDSSWHHTGRTFDEQKHIPAEELFRDVRVVMDPKAPVEGSTYNDLRRVYGDYIAANFDLVRETEYWRVSVAKMPVASVQARRLDAAAQR